MSRIVVVGSGASGVHFALSALRKGHEVLMLDVGRRGPRPPLPGQGFVALRAGLDDPAAFFLGERFEALELPGRAGEYYGFPPSKLYVFDPPADWAVHAHGFAPLASFARGGLAEAWTGGVYPFIDAELERFPFSYREIAPYYEEVARRIGVSGARDDLERFVPYHDHIMAPTRLDRHAELLLSAYQTHKDRFNRGLRCWLGRSRVAVLTAPRDEREECRYLGRCLWGCPIGSLYTPSHTLQECLSHRGFTYMPGTMVTHFEVGTGGRVTEVVARSMNGDALALATDHLVLAAGTLSSSWIFLSSLRRFSGDTVRLPGLMDNRQILVPFVTPRLAGLPFEPDEYQYHQLAAGLGGGSPDEYVHVQITTLTTALAHPIVESLPFDLRTSLFLFRNLRAGLGLANVNLHDRRRDDSYVTLGAPARNGLAPAKIVHRPDPDEPQRIRSAVKRTKAVLRKLGCFVPPGLAHVRPMGASVHYAGTVPMRRDPAPLTASELCRSHDIDNLWFVDGTTVPFLPAKNVTFTLMANAVRVAEEAF